MYLSIYNIYNTYNIYYIMYIYIINIINIISIYITTSINYFLTCLECLYCYLWSRWTQWLIVTLNDLFTIVLQSSGSKNFKIFSGKHPWWGSQLLTKTLLQDGNFSGSIQNSDFKEQFKTVAFRNYIQLKGIFRS